MTDRAAKVVDEMERGNITLALAGVQDYFSLTTSGGTTNVKSAIGTGFSIVNANAAINFGADQTLEELNIGDGAVVALDAALPSPALAFAVGSAGQPVPARPAPGAGR